MKPLCPVCKTGLLIVEKFTIYSACDGFEEDDPLAPIVGERVEEFGDETYHPHYYCDKCSVDYGFDLKPITYKLVEADLK